MSEWWGLAHFHTFPVRLEVESSDAIITGLVLVCHRDASILFDLGSIYSYVSSYFASQLIVHRDSLNALVYVSTPMGDSIIVDRFYRSQEEHEQYLRVVLQTLRDSRLCTMFSNCEFWWDSVAILGHVVSTEGIKLDPKKNEAVQNWPRPTSAREILSFLYLAGYYRRYLESKESEKNEGPAAANSISSNATVLTA
uniref:Uncharacterized protein n=2 Tax=Nicotiana TaxID=4085 RepID=A0A1S3Y7E7_TOBAC|nr:PREDICTED: uncharacterized protein LOC104219040 [Nicotiana sylvestris]XP_016448191.1 PREDICTED: uncharacterized protein LOC107773259 [Nicotiana tabacum]